MCLIRYEDLTANPKKITKQIFRFIGSKKKEGVTSYRKPENFVWRWGFDDGGENIQKLTVLQPPNEPEQDDVELVKIITNAPRVHALRNRLGYSNNKK
jgi:hypothetical protein